MAGKQGPPPGQVVVACSYYTQENLQELLGQSRGTEARELSTRLQAVTWIDNIRQALELPVQTFCTAAEKFQRFNLKYNAESSSWTDVAATALSLACKVEDTHKKSKDILCAAYNLKASPAEKVTPDHESVTVLTGLERLMLENSAFDFRTRYPHLVIAKLARTYGLKAEHSATVVKTAYYMGTDAYRTWAPLKHVPAAIALACVELAGRLYDANVAEVEECKDYDGNGRFPEVRRPMVMECMLDLLDLYTHHRASTIEGANFPIDKYISVRINLNNEANANDWPRFIGCSENFNKTWSTAPSPNDPDVVNGRSDKTSPTSPVANAATARVKGDVATPSTPTRHPQQREMTMRFTLDRERAAEEKGIVDAYMDESEEEYEVEVEEEVEVEDRWDNRDRHDHHRFNRRGGRH